MTHNVVIAGVGPGLGAALARKFCREGCQVAMLARHEKFLDQLARELRGLGGEAFALPTDLTNGRQVASAFAKIRQRWGSVNILIYNASGAVWKSLLKIKPEEFEQAWRTGVLGGLLCAQEAARDMLPRRSGAILFTGATSSVRGRAGAVGFSSAKFALRGLADSLARELWPKGIHVAHVILDGMIDTPAVRRKFRPKANEPLLQADAIADTFWSLALQKTGAWSAEVDLRPFNEAFFA